MTHPILDSLRSNLQARADAEVARGMQAYLKTDQPFYGVKSGPRREILRAARREFPLDSQADYREVINDLWQGVHREEMYLALDVAEKCRAFRTLESWPIYVGLVESSTWWDTLDWIAAKLVGELVLEHRQLEEYLVQWRVAPGMWVRRTSLLAHLKHKERTNTVLLAETILILAPEKEFFIRKAIGWVLREYAKSDPAWVRGFVGEHTDRLSGLSRREALKNIGGE